jgi:hypothetical protein
VFPCFLFRLSGAIPHRETPVIACISILAFTLLMRGLLRWFYLTFSCLLGGIVCAETCITFPTAWMFRVMNEAIRRD